MNINSSYKQKYIKYKKKYLILKNGGSSAPKTSTIGNKAEIAEVEVAPVGSVEQLGSIAPVGSIESEDEFSDTDSDDGSYVEFSDGEDEDEDDDLLDKKTEKDMKIADIFKDIEKKTEGCNFKGWHQRYFDCWLDSALFAMFASNYINEIFLTRLNKLIETDQELGENYLNYINNYANYDDGVLYKMEKRKIVDLLKKKYSSDPTISTSISYFFGKVFPIFKSFTDGYSDIEYVHELTNTSPLDTFVRTIITGIFPLKPVLIITIESFNKFDNSLTLRKLLRFDNYHLVSVLYGIDKKDKKGQHYRHYNVDINCGDQWDHYDNENKLPDLRSRLPANHLDIPQQFLKSDEISLIYLLKLI